MSRVYNDDCLDVLSNLKNDSVDLIATDPPYEINFEKNKWDKPNQLNWDVLASEFKRICKPNANIIIFQGWSNVCTTKNTLDKYFDIKDWIIYDRIKGRGGKKSLVSTREDILWYVCNPNDYTYNKISSTIKKKTGGTIGKRNGNEFRALSNVWTDISPIVPWSKERVKHPTQKPLQIMNRIITLFSNENDVVLDPFMGSGSTCMACFSLNRRYIGIEKDIEYFNVFQNRIKEKAVEFDINGKVISGTEK